MLSGGGGPGCCGLLSSLPGPTTLCQEHPGVTPQLSPDVATVPRGWDHRIRDPAPRQHTCETCVTHLVCNQ